MGQQNDERELGQFGGLKTLVRDTQPAPGAAGLDAHAAGNQNHHEQPEGDQEKRNGNIFEMTIVNAGDDPRRDQSQAAPDDLGPRIIRARLAHAGTVKHHQPE